MQETALLLESPHVKISLFILSATASSDAFVLLSTPPWSFPVDLPSYKWVHHAGHTVHSSCLILQIPQKVGFSEIWRFKSDKTVDT